jgi:hypothetical protein
MSVDPARIISQPAAPQPSTPQSPVAPSAPVQGGVGAPGVFSQQPAGQPAPQPQPNPTPQAPVNPNLGDPRVMGLQNEVNQYRGLMTQIQQAAQQNQQDQQLQNQLAMIQATYDNLPAEQAGQYLKTQIQNIVGGVRMSAEQARQQERQQMEMALRQAASGAQPTYLDHLTQAYQLTPEARQELAQLGDPDLMHRMAPVIKQRYDQMQAQLGQYQQNQTQQARSQEVMALSQAGLTHFGGQAGAGDVQLEVSDDPDERAMQIYDYLKRTEMSARSGVQPAMPVIPSMPG